MAESRENARPVHVVEAEEVSETGSGQTDGMVRQMVEHEQEEEDLESHLFQTKVCTVKREADDLQNQTAIVGISPSICGTLMRAQPHSSSAVHHHGSQDTIVYAVSGTGAIHSLDDSAEGSRKVQTLRPGDWALIPAFREHMEVNESDEEVVWVIVRAPGGTPEVVNLDGWKGEEK